jgi:hypothetical protein
MQDITSVRQVGDTFVVEADGRVFSVPDDMGNGDRISLQKWLDNGGTLTEDKSAEQPAYKWRELAIAFTKSRLNNEILTPIKHEATNPRVNEIWDLTDRLSNTITLPVFSEQERAQGVQNILTALLGALSASGVNVPTEYLQEIGDALRENGFEAIAEAVIRS